MLNALSAKKALALGIATGFILSGAIGFYVIVPMALRAETPTAILDDRIEPNNTETAEQNALPNIPKNDKPKVELFVMSYCPFGLQMEKAYTPVWNLLKNKADLSVKFVSYAMHGKIEVDENTRQHCIQQEEGADKFITYLNCFSLKNDSAGCLNQSGINNAKINSCVEKTNKNFAILDKYNDKSTWLNGRFPLYPVHENLNDEYGVQGSPTLVINGTQVQTERTPEGIKNAICAAFNNAPSECSKKLSNTPATPGVGAGEGVDTGDAGCGK